LRKIIRHEGFSDIQTDRSIRTPEWREICSLRIAVM
jgi:hypothetical protein